MEPLPGLTSGTTTTRTGLPDDNTDSPDISIPSNASTAGSVSVPASPSQPASVRLPPLRPVACSLSHRNIIQNDAYHHHHHAGLPSSTTISSLGHLHLGSTTHDDDDDNIDDNHDASTAIPLTSISHLSPPSPPPPPPPRSLPRPLTFSSLPSEVHIAIIAQLPTLADIRRLGHTCRALHALASPPAIRLTLGPRRTDSLLRSTCSRCLAHDEAKTATLEAVPDEPGYPFTGVCVRCARAAADDRLRVGRRVRMAADAAYWVCRWCGWPIEPGTEAVPPANRRANGNNNNNNNNGNGNGNGNVQTAATASAPGHLQFHAKCRGRYLNVLMLFFMLGWAQLGLGLAGAAMAWKFWRGVHIVFTPATLAFVMLWICVIVILCRNDRRPKYWLALPFEVMILLLWLPPITYVGMKWADPVPGEHLRAVKSSTVIFGINMLFRLLNVIGTIALLINYDKTKHHLPEIPLWRRLTNPFMSFLIYWTYPSHVERKYPPDYL